MIVPAQTRDRDSETKDRLEREISTAASKLIGLPPDRVCLVAPHTVPEDPQRKDKTFRVPSTLAGGKPQ